MLKNELQTFWRTLIKRPFHTSINLLGLSAGITCVLLIAVYLNHQLGFDQHQPNRDRIYRMVLSVKTNSGNDFESAENFFGLAPTLKSSFPEVEDAVRLYPYKGDVQVNYKSGRNPVFSGAHIYRTEPTVFNVFRHDFIQGNPNNALNDPNSIVLTQSLANKYFGNNSPINKALTLDKTTYRVTGIIGDIPKNSDLYYEALMAHDFSLDDDDWGNNGGYTYTLLKEQHDLLAFQKKLDQTVKAKTDNYMMQEYDLNGKVQIYPQVLSGIHFEKPLIADTPKVNLTYINILKVLGWLIFIIVVFNYGNYTASYYTERLKEISIRKYFGAAKSKILGKFMLEMTSVALFVILTSIILFALSIPYLNDLTSNEALEINVLLEPNILSILSVLLISVLGISVLYPVLYLLNLAAYKGITGKSAIKGNNSFRRILMSLQFFGTAIMVFFTLVVFFQMKFLENKNLGFDGNQVMVVDIPAFLLDESKTASLIAELEKLSSVNQVSVVAENAYPGNRNTNYQYGWLYKNNQKLEANFNLFGVDQDFISLLNIELALGDSFTKPNENKNAIYPCLVNEAFIQEMGFKSAKDALGETVYAFEEEFHITGIVRDFHYQGIKEKVNPLLIYNNNTFGLDAKNLLISLNQKEGINTISSTLKSFDASLVNYSFLDESFAQLYQQEKTIGHITSIFCLISMLLAGIGLYAISSLFLAQRAKEIGIRKILGANSKAISVLLTKEFLLVVLFSFALAAPFAWYQSSIWLERFAYKIQIDGGIFFLAFALLMLITIGGIAVNLVKGLHIKPVALLRDE